MSVNRVTAAAGSRQRGGGKNRRRIQTLVYVETKTVRTSTGDVVLRLLAQGGRIGLGEVTETGEPVFVPLERLRTHPLRRRGTARLIGVGVD